MSEETDAWSSRTLLKLGNLHSDVWEGNTNHRDAVTFWTIAGHTAVGVGVRFILASTDGRDTIENQDAVSLTTFSGVGR